MRATSLLLAPRSNLREPGVSAQRAAPGKSRTVIGALKGHTELGLAPKYRPSHFLTAPQSLASVLIHLVFSTKNRERWISDSIRDELHAYIGGTISARKGTLLAAGSVEDHIHLLISFPRDIAPSELVKEIKSGSSKWLKERDKEFAGFHWQAGYGMFSISPAHRENLEAYIAGQRDHHRKVSFEDEYRRLLSRYGLDFDERYVWD